MENKLPKIDENGREPVDLSDISAEEARNFLMRKATEDDLALPNVVVPGGSMSITGSAKRLFEVVAPKKKLFVRGGYVTRLGNRDGRVVLERLEAGAARSEFEKYVQFVKASGKTPWLTEETVLTKDQADSYLQAEERYVLPVINGVINCPILVESKGELKVVDKGYDDETGLLVLGENALPEVTLEDAKFYLSGLVEDFDFDTQSDKSRALASFITPALRFGGLLKGHIPIDVAEANASQSGKTFRQQMIAALYNETLSVITKKEGAGVGSMEEAFGTHLVAGSPFIQFDNVRGKFHNQSLESFLTAKDRFGARPAYSKQVDVDPTKFVILINSNGYESTPDQANRSSIVRIRKREGHVFKRWIEGGVERGSMMDFIHAYQPLLLASVFRIVKEWHRRGKPRTTETRHSFQDWCQTLDWIVQEIFGEAPLMDGHIEAQKRVSSPDHTFLRALAVALEGKNKIWKELRAGEIFDLCQEARVSIPSLSPDSRNDSDAGGKVIGKIMSRVFGDTDSIEVDVFKIVRIEKAQTSSTGNSYPGKLYKFERTGGQPNAGESPEVPKSKLPSLPNRACLS